MRSNTVPLSFELNKHQFTKPLFQKKRVVEKKLSHMNNLAPDLVIKERKCQLGSLRNWRYCVGARLKFGSGAVFLTARDVSAVKSHSTILQRLCRQISLDYYTIPPATQATIGCPLYSLIKHSLPDLS